MINCFKDANKAIREHFSSSNCASRKDLINFAYGIGTAIGCIALVIGASVVGVYIAELLGFNPRDNEVMYATIAIIGLFVGIVLAIYLMIIHAVCSARRNATDPAALAYLRRLAYERVMLTPELNHTVQTALEHYKRFQPELFANVRSEDVLTMIQDLEAVITKEVRNVQD